MKASDVRLTPEWLLDLVREFAGGRIGVDPATESHNPTEAEYPFWPGAGIPLRDCGLGVDWSTFAKAAHHRGASPTVFCNPPYSAGQVVRWATKAIEQAARGCEIVLLTRADTRTRWLTMLRQNADAVCFVRRSIGFVMPDGTQLPGDFYGHALWYWGRRRARFRRVFEAQGWWVLDLPGVQEAQEPKEVDVAAE